MEDDLAPFSLDDLLADTEFAPTPPARAPAAPGPTYPEDPDQARRDRIRAAGLASGRIRGWTRLTGRKLCAQWVPRFEDAPDVARDAALWAAERMIRGKEKGSQERLFAVKRVFLGIHARGQLDARREQRGLDAIWPLDVIDHDAYLQLPLPLKGILRLLEYAAWRRARIPACRLRPSR